MKISPALPAALMLLASAHATFARTEAHRWRKIHQATLLTGTDNGGTLEIFRSGASRKLRVEIWLSSSIVRTDYLFEGGRLVLADVTRTQFGLATGQAEGGIDTTKPVFMQNGRYRFRGGRLISRVTRTREVGGRWKYGVEVRPKVNGPTGVASARYFLHAAASRKSEVDVERWIKGPA